MSIDVGDMFVYTHTKNIWPFAVVGDSYICVSLNRLADKYTLDSVGLPNKHSIVASFLETQFHFKLVTTGAPVKTLAAYSIGDVLILTSPHPAIPSFVTLGAEIKIRYMSPGLNGPVYDLLDNVGRYIGSFNENDLNNFFTRKLGFGVASNNWQRVGEQMVLNIIEHYGKKKKCDCGAEKTYGANCNEFSHSRWCETLTKD